MGQVFIVGCSRTGSTLLQQIINKYTPIDVLEECHVLLPFWLNEDFSTKLNNEIEVTNEPQDIKKVIDLIYSHRCYGIFWEQIERFNLNKSLLAEQIKINGITEKGVFKALMEASRIKNHKAMCGAKFPVYVGYAHKLFEWFPDCKIIHTIRDPRAIYASQLYKRTNEKFGKAKNLIIGLQHFVHINLQFRHACKAHMQLKTNPNYFPFYYEKLIADPGETLERLCSFLDIPFDTKMLKPNTYVNTSFREKKTGKGFHKDSLNSWQNRLPSIISDLIFLLNKQNIKSFES